MVSDQRQKTKAKAKANTAKRADPVPDYKPWREAGWIFKDGEVIAIEREGNETRARKIEG